MVDLVDSEFVFDSLPNSEKAGFAGLACLLKLLLQEAKGLAYFKSFSFSFAKL